MIYMLKKILIILFISLLPNATLGNNASDLFNNEEYDAAYRAAYAEALSGDSESSFVIGQILIEGKGSSKKALNKGINFIKKAAENDYLKAVIFLAKAYEEGKLTSKSNSRSLKYYEQCEKLGGSSKCSKKVTKKRIASSGAVSKKSCERYNKSSKKLANTIGKCIVAGHLDGTAHKYFFRSFDSGNTNAFLSASRDILKKKSKSHFMKVIKRIPRFDKKASKKQKQKFKDLLLDYGYSNGECGTEKNALGFSTKGDVPSCVLAAASGNQKAAQKAAIWWRDGLHGLPKNKSYYKKMINQAQDGAETDIAAILEVLKVDPREHFKKAKEYLINNPMNSALVAKAFKVELELLADKKHQEFASGINDVVTVLEIVDWSVIDPQKLGKFIYFYYQDLSKIKELSTSEIKKNIEKINFSEEMFIELVSQGKGAGKLSNEFLSGKIFTDCNAFEYISKNTNLVPLKTLKSAQKVMFKQCKNSESETKSMKALLLEGLDDLEAVKIPIEYLLSERKPCLNYSDFLLYKELPVPDDYFNVDFTKLNKKCSKFGIVSYSLAKIAFSTASKLDDKSEVEKEYNNAFKYSKKACKSDQARGCELVASMIRQNISIGSSEYGYNQRDAGAITYLEIGHKAGDIKSTAMLFDIYDQNFSSISNTKKALKLLNQLNESEDLAAEIRVKKECFSNRNLDLFKMITQNCTAVCAFAKSTLENKKLDQGSISVLKEIGKKEVCKR